MSRRRALSFRLGLIAAAVGLVDAAGCADTYLVPDAAMERLSRFSEAARSRIALSAVRERDQATTWVRADEVVPVPTDAPARPGYRRMREAHAKRRVTPLGMSLFVAGVVGLSVSMVFVGTANSCTSQGALPCLPTSGDWAIPTTLASAALFSIGGASSLARAVDAHPAEVGGSDEGLLYLGVPEPAGVAKTPLE